MGLGRSAGGRDQQQKSGKARRPSGWLRLCGVALVAGSAVLAAASPVDAAAGQQTAVFDVEIYDTSGEGARPDLEQRLARISEELREGLAASPDYELVDLTPAADRIAALGHRYGCNGCEAAIAREFGATRYVTALIHKVSTLILSITITVHDAETGAAIRVGSADIRGDNDRAWSHGVGWLLRNRILAD